ncbi:hypothetical protein HT031_002419 [Scenedesmus sp. PABB004]|nr:hypothetical protein HT031_002419 [Scenedesmus sp. PABB004]
MASTLASQLAALAVAQGPSERWVRGKASLLFPYDKAADVSAEQLLSIAAQGLEALCRADKRFAPFPDSLFSRASLGVAREQLTREENEALDANLRAFLRVLTNHLLAPAAFQALEYCVRRYAVHVHNVGDLLLCALPYHATPEFARLVALLQLKGTPWAWLEPAQTSGAPPPRELLVLRCANDEAVLREVCRGAQALGEPGFVSKTYLSFYGVLLSELFATAPSVGEGLLGLLLPFLVSGLRADAPRDYRAATLMGLTSLLRRAQLATDFLAVVIVEVVRGAPDLGGTTGLMLLAHLAASQPHLTALPLRALQLLAAQEGVGQQLADLQARGAKLGPLMSLLLPSLAAALPGQPALLPLLLALLRHLDLDPALVQGAAAGLLRAGAAAHAAQGGTAAPHVGEALRALDLRFPDQLDAAINAALRDAGAAEAPAPGGGRRGKAAKGGAKAQRGGADALFTYVQACFSGSRHEVLSAGDGGSEAGGGGGAALTLSLAVAAPASGVRAMALRKLDAACAEPDAPASTRELLAASLASCLHDEALEVAATAASAAGLASVPPDAALAGLTALLSRAASALAAGHGGEGEPAGGGKQALAAAKAGLAAVAAVGECAAAAAVAAADSEAQAAAARVARGAAALLLEHCLGDRRLKRLARAAVAVAGAAEWHPLLAALAAAPGVAAALEAGGGAAAAAAAAEAPGSNGKRRKKGAKGSGAADAAAGDAAAGDKHAAAVALNRAVVRALSDGLTGALASELAAVAADCGPRCRHLLLLALVHAAAASPADEDGADAPHSPRGRGRGRQHRASSSQAGGSQAGSGDAAATAARVAAALLALLEQALGPAGGKKRRAGAAGLQLPDDWAAAAAAALDADLLPTRQHLQQLHAALPELHGALLLAGLRTALARASAEGLGELLGRPGALFARLAAVAAAQPSLLEHAGLLVAKCGADAAQQLRFLSGVYGLPPAACGEAVQAAALQLLHWQAGDAAPAAARAAPDGDGAWLVSLLAAADSPSKRVRRAAVDALLALPGLVAGAPGWALAGGFSAEHLAALAAALQPHEALLRDAHGALTPLLVAAVAAGGGGGGGAASAARPKTPRRGSKTGGARGLSSDGGGAAAEAGAVAEVQLPPACAHALQQLLLAALPALAGDAQLLGAELAVAVLRAGGGAGDAAAAAAQQLLRELLLGLAVHARAAAGGHGARGGDAPLWQSLAAALGDDAAAEAGAALQALRGGLAVAAVGFASPEAVAADAGVAARYLGLLQLPLLDAAAVGLDAAAPGGGRLSAAQLAAVAPARTAALAALGPAMLEALGGDGQAAFAAALQAHATDGDAACRAAARAALERLPVSAGMLLPLLARVGGAAGGAPPTPAPKAKRARRASSAASGSGSQAEAMDVDGGAAPAGPVAAADLDAATAALELLQWKEAVAGRAALAAPLQALLRALLPRMGSVAERHGGSDDDEPGGDAGDAGGEAADAEGEPAAGAGAASASAAGYAAQLALLVLDALAQEAQAAGAPPGVDAGLVLLAASAAPDGAVRNAALQLLAVLARSAPERVLEYVLQALAVIQHSAAFQADAHSQAVAAAALAALVPAWLAGGRRSEELWAALIDALPGLPGPRRLRLLEALQGALPQEAGLPVGLLIMMRRVVAAAAAPAAPAAEAAARSPAGRKGRRAPAPAAAPEPPGEPAPATEADWLPDLIGALCEKVPVAQRLAAFAAVLEAALADGGGAHAPLPRLAVSLVTANLKAKSVVAAAGAAAAAADPAGAPALQAACRGIMRQALTHLQQLAPGAAAGAAPAGAGPAKGARRAQRAMRAGAAGVYDLLSALEAVQDCPSYLAALVEMSRHDDASVQRRALKLLAARLSRAAVDVAAAEARAADAPPAERAAAVAGLGAAALSVAGELPRLLAAPAPLTRQLALVAADAGVRQFGAASPGAVLAALPHVLAGAVDPSGPVRVSALACLASCVAAVGTRLVPLLPQAAAVALGAAQAAAAELEGFDHAAAAAAAAAAEEQPAEAASDDDGGDARDGGAFGRGQEAALQLAGALAALEALVVGLGPFLSPYLRPLLRLLLQRPVLDCRTAGGAATAARLRAALPARVPPRLLVEPLVGAWDAALAACGGGGGGPPSAAPAVALLELVGAAARGMEPAVAATYHEPLAGLLLRALDTRQRWLAAAVGGADDGAAAAAAAAAGDAGAAADAAAAAAAAARLGGAAVAAVEGAAVEALCCLVMKLSESRFKPLFLRLLDWAGAGGGASGSSAGAAPGAAGRAAAFLAACVALGHRLRRVFVPYQRYLGVLLMQQLAGEALAGGGGGKRPKKKAKRASAGGGGAPEAAAGGAGGDAAALCGWLARLRAARLVHLLALHEPPPDGPAAQQEQAERFERLLPLLVEMLSDAPPAALAAALAEQGADAALDPPGGPLAPLGAAGRAAAEAGAGDAAAALCDAAGAAALGALHALAVASGSDAVWKPLHHGVLLASRGAGGPRPRLLALGAVSRLAELLREEYLMLLPEALPYVAELLEEPELAVEAAAQGLVAQLEALSGEKLDQYLKA